MIEKLGVEVLNVCLFDGWKNIVLPLVFNGVNPYFFSPLSNQVYNDKIGGLGSGGLDSDWIPENEMDWDA